MIQSRELSRKFLKLVCASLLLLYHLDAHLNHASQYDLEKVKYQCGTSTLFLAKF